MSHAGTSGHQALGPGREFDAIRDLLSRWGSLATGIGDDAAVMDVPPDTKLVISTDAIVEHVHFERHWVAPIDLGVRGAAAALSDLAAMGATADGVLVAFIVPPSWRDELGAIADGIAQVVRPSGARIVGGNVTAGDTFSCTFTVFGHSANPIARQGAKVGDVLMVTGVLGGPAAAIAAWTRGDDPAKWARLRFVAPVPRLSEGRWLAEHGAHAMIDISDGLAADARHLATASALTCTLAPDRVLRYPDVSVADALVSGEEYELLAAFPAERADAVADEFMAHFGLPLTVVGKLDPLSPDDGRGGTRGSSAGYDHFSSR